MTDGVSLPKVLRKYLMAARAFVRWLPKVKSKVKYSTYSTVQYIRPCQSKPLYSTPHHYNPFNLPVHIQTSSPSPTVSVFIFYFTTCKGIICSTPTPPLSHLPPPLLQVSLLLPTHPLDATQKTSTTASSAIPPRLPSSPTSPKSTRLLYF